MARRLSRAKEKISRAGIRFETPEARELGPRLAFVLEAIYAAYGSGWEDVTETAGRLSGLPGETIHLGRVVVALMPGAPEARGLLALMLHCEARRRARRGKDGSFVPLAEQDAALWSLPMIEEAERELGIAAEAGRPGRFQIEAAIQSAHASRRLDGGTACDAIAVLYEGLVSAAPTLGALVGRAAAVAEARGPAAGWALLQAVPEEVRGSYQPYWALAGHLQVRLGRMAEARQAYIRAIGLSEDPATRAFLKKRLAAASRPA